MFYGLYPLFLGLVAVAILMSLLRFLRRQVEREACSDPKAAYGSFDVQMFIATGVCGIGWISSFLASFYAHGETLAVIRALTTPLMLVIHHMAVQIACRATHRGGSDILSTAHSVSVSCFLVFAMSAMTYWSRVCLYATIASFLFAAFIKHLSVDQHQSMRAADNAA
jgi:hypothetical protein